MCGRVIIPSTEEILENFDLTYIEEELRPSQINIPPGGMQIPVFTDSKSKELQYFAWPLLPYWTPDKKVPYSTANATIEKMLLKDDPKPNTWSKLYGKHHCVIITSGFYEWQYEDPTKKTSVKYPHIIRTKGEKFTLMAGLWNAVKDPSNGTYYASCSMITLPANEFMAEIHNTKGRMPAFLTNETAKIWTDKEIPLTDRQQALHPVENDFLVAHKVKSVADEEEVYGVLEIC